MTIGYAVSVVLLRRRHVAFELLQEFRDDLVLLRLGPDGQFAGLGVGEDLDPGQFASHARLNGREPLPLPRSHRVDDQLALLQRRGGLFVFIDRRRINAWSAAMATAMSCWALEASGVIWALVATSSRIFTEDAAGPCLTG